uniref:RING-type E3 ubiquitin transferase n=1 Tax=Elaeis guineensis var. tenera TaxID=51953 RepID=A0A6J0PK90_ELAGV|nr:RING-H2 finger protein ATL64-like [Elaeis guineensis]
MVLPDPRSHWKECLRYFFLAICLMLLFCTCCRIVGRNFTWLRTRRRLPISENNSDEPSTQLQSTGLASAVVRSLPAIPFRKGIKEGDGHENNKCVICLRKFHGGEWLRLLPNCAHLFHVRCIDTWFRSHSTCPVCRTNVLYDFNDWDSSVSMVDSLETLQREEKALGYRLLQSHIMRSPGWEVYMSGPLYETESDESFQGFVSPVGRPSNQRQAVQNLIKIAPNNNGESSSRDPGSNNEDNVYAPGPLA